MSNTRLHDQIAANRAQHKQEALQAQGRVARPAPMEDMCLALNGLENDVVPALSAGESSVRWRLCNGSGTAPCSLPKTERYSLRNWWDKVVAWHAAEMEHAASVHSALGAEAFEKFHFDLVIRVREVQVALQKAWNDTHHGLPASWANGMFCIHFEE